jgi:hypothetical protein
MSNAQELEARFEIRPASNSSNSSASGEIVNDAVRARPTFA